MNTLNKIILTTAIQGLVWTAILFSYGIGIFAMAFPAQMASFYDTAGDSKLGAMYHGRVYDRKPSTQNLYYAFSKNVEAKNTKGIIKYGKIWFEKTDEWVRDDITDEVDEVLIASAQGNTVALGLVGNTDDYLRRGYIRALLARKQNTKAEKLLLDVIDTSAPDFVLNLARPSYALFEFPANYSNIEVLKTKWLAYYNAFIDEVTPDANPKAQFFKEHAMEMFNGAFND